MKKARKPESTKPPAEPLLPVGMQVEMWPIDRPIPYAKNARKLSPRALDVIMASLKEFGWQQPIVVDAKDVIVAGHTRLMGGKKLGMTQVPVHVAANLTPAQCAAYRLMDNRSTQETSWDSALLGPELSDLQGLNFDLALTGFDGPEIAALLGEPAGRLDGETPAAGEQPSNPGAPVISYSIVFNTEAEQSTWFGFLRALKGVYPEAETIAERLILYIGQHAPPEPQKSEKQ